MKYACVFIVIFLFTSCDYFNVKKTSTEDILQEELQTFNWNEVDEYPTFSVCDSLSTKPEKKQCFESTLTTHLTHYLADQQFVVDRDIKDTLWLTFNVTDKGKVSILDIKIKEQTRLELPQIRQVLLDSPDSLPQIFPALKRGQQVTSQFKLPVVISVN